MSVLRLLPLVVLAAGTIAIYGPSSFAQAPEDSGGSGEAAIRSLSPRLIETTESPTVPSTSADTLYEPFSWVPDLAEECGEALARQAARMDPGILIYTEPPAGTDTPIWEPPEHVDPEMILPNDP